MKIKFNGNLVIKPIIYILLVALMLRILICYFDIFNIYINMCAQYFVKDNPIGELIRFFLLIVGAIVAIRGLYINNRRVKEQNRQNNISEKGNVDARYINAIGHLNNTNPAIVLGGLHALHQIAKENNTYIPLVHDVFCSYVRESSVELNSMQYRNACVRNQEKKVIILINVADEDSTSTIKIKCPVTIQTVLDYLFEHTNNSVCIYKARRSDLTCSHLSYCIQWENTVENIDFWSTMFDSCDFKGSTIKNCSFEKSIFNKCNFSDVKFESCDFKEAKFRGCDLKTTCFLDCANKEE